MLACTCRPHNPTNSDLLSSPSPHLHRAHRGLQYIMLCICIGTIYFNLDNSWVGTYSRSAMMFFVVAFLTFM